MSPCAVGISQEANFLVTESRAVCVSLVQPFLAGVEFAFAFEPEQIAALDCPDVLATLEMYRLLLIEFPNANVEDTQEGLEVFRSDMRIVRAHRDGA